MTAADRSYIGLAKQTQKGTINSTDASFAYLLFNGAGISVNNQNLPLDQEAGGGAMLRQIEKTGYFSGGAIEFIPRCDSIGNFLMGALGATSKTGAAVPYTHFFKLGTDQFDAPYYTIRSMPGGLWGETFQDVRVAGLSLNWRAANFVRAQAQLLGGAAVGGVSVSGWAPAAKVDGTAPFITATGKIELPDGTALKAIAGAFTARMDIPLDEQWIVGSYMPDDFAINQRGFDMRLSVLVTSSEKTLYEKITYDASGSTQGWVAGLFKEGLIDMEFKGSSKLSDNTTYPTLRFKGNGQTGITNGNIVVTGDPIYLRSGKQVVMNLGATWLADSARDPITLELINANSAGY